MDAYDEETNSEAAAEFHSEFMENVHYKHKELFHNVTTLTQGYKLQQLLETMYHM